MTEGREAILPGTLYAALARMVDEGLVIESTPKNDASGGPSRRYYQRTKFGRAVARAESERLRALLDVARAQSLFGGPKWRVCRLERDFGGVEQQHGCPPPYLRARPSWPFEKGTGWMAATKAKHEKSRA